MVELPPGSRALPLEHCRSPSWGQSTRTNPSESVLSPEQRRLAETPRVCWGRTLPGSPMAPPGPFEHRRLHRSSTPTAPGPPLMDSPPRRVQVSSPEQRRRLAGGYGPRRDREYLPPVLSQALPGPYGGLSSQQMPFRTPPPGLLPAKHRPAGTSPPPIPRGRKCQRADPPTHPFSGPPFG
jgi:hypothetical protein